MHGDMTGMKLPEGGCYCGTMNCHDCCRGALLIKGWNCCCLFSFAANFVSLLINLFPLSHHLCSLATFSNPKTSSHDMASPPNPGLVVSPTKPDNLAPSTPSPRAAAAAAAATSPTFPSSPSHAPTHRSRSDTMDPEAEQTGEARLKQPLQVMDGLGEDEEEVEGGGHAVVGRVDTMDPQVEQTGEAPVVLAVAPALEGLKEDINEASEASDSAGKQRRALENTLAMRRKEREGELDKTMASDEERAAVQTAIAEEEKRLIAELEVKLKKVTQDAAVTQGVASPSSPIPNASQNAADGLKGDAEPIFRQRSDTMAPQAEQRDAAKVPASKVEAPAMAGFAEDEEVN